MTLKKTIATLMVAGLLFSGCGIKNQNAIIKVNNSAITQKDFDELMDKAVANSPFAQMSGMDIKKDKNGMLYLMTAQRVLNQLIVQELLNQEAKERGIKVSKKEVDEAISKIIEKMGGKDQLMEVLKTNKVSVAQFKEDVKTQEKMHKLAKSIVKTKVTDKDCKDFYDKNIDKFKNPEQVRASHILIEANPYQIQQAIETGSKEKLSENEVKSKIEARLNEQKALAERLSKELQADASKFKAYAKKYSADTISAKQGGDLGFFSKERMVPEFSKYAFSAKPNKVSDPVKTQYGYHIIVVTDRRAAGTVPYEKAKSDIKEFLKTENEIKALDDLTNSLKKKSKIEILDEQYDPEKINKKLMEQLGKLKQKAVNPENSQKTASKKK